MSSPSDSTGGLHKNLDVDHSTTQQRRRLQPSMSLVLIGAIHWLHLRLCASFLSEQVYRSNFCSHAPEHSLELSHSAPPRPGPRAPILHTTPTSPILMFLRLLASPVGLQEMGVNYTVLKPRLPRTIDRHNAEMGTCWILGHTNAQHSLLPRNPPCHFHDFVCARSSLPVTLRNLPP